MFIKIIYLKTNGLILDFISSGIVVGSKSSFINILNYIIINENRFQYNN